MRWLTSVIAFFELLRMAIFAGASLLMRAGPNGKTKHEEQRNPRKLYARTTLLREDGMLHVPEWSLWHLIFAVLSMVPCAVRIMLLPYIFYFIIIFFASALFRVLFVRACALLLSFGSFFFMAFIRFVPRSSRTWTTCGNAAPSRYVCGAPRHEAVGACHLTDPKKKLSCPYVTVSVKLC